MDRSAKRTIVIMGICCSTLFGLTMTLYTEKKDQLQEQPGQPGLPNTPTDQELRDAINDYEKGLAGPDGPDGSQ